MASTLSPSKCPSPADSKKRREGREGKKEGREGREGREGGREGGRKEGDINNSYVYLHVHTFVDITSLIYTYSEPASIQIKTKAAALI